MLALILWMTLGSRVAAAEMFVELAVGFILYCGTGAGRRAMLEPALDPPRWADLTTRSQNEVMRCASLLKSKEKRHGNHGRRTVV